MATYILLSPKNLKLMSVSWQTKSPANKRRYRKPSTFSHLQMKKKNEQELPNVVRSWK